MPRHACARAALRLPAARAQDAIRHLLSRGTHREFGYGALLAFLVLYSCGAAAAAGSCLSSGTLVPMLLMGATIGRLCGLLMARL